jgi:hypothetical protein
MEVYDDTVVEKTAKDTMLKFFPSYKYVSPLDYCPMVGPQIIEAGLSNCKGGGFCAVWSTLYGHLRILNPDVSRQEIIKEMLKMATVPQFMQKYITYIDSIVPDKGKILF